VLSISARTLEDLLRQLKAIDISVPPIEKGRSTQDCERWSICRLLATIAKSKALSFPIKLQKRERPDFCLQAGQKLIGIEFTEAIQPNYARVRVLPEARLEKSIIDPSLFKWGAPKKSLEELRSIASQTQLTGPGWEGNAMEDEWSQTIIDIASKKTSKLNSDGFARYIEDWLLVYDNLDSGDLDLSCSYLKSDLQEYWSPESFNSVFVETGDCIIEFNAKSFTKVRINNVWKSEDEAPHPTTG
jgi:hypothetical protein